MTSKAHWREIRFGALKVQRLQLHDDHETANETKRSSLLKKSANNEHGLIKPLNKLL